jgi:hypothetical protein
MTVPPSLGKIGHTKGFPKAVCVSFMPRVFHPWCKGHWMLRKRQGVGANLNVYQDEYVDLLYGIYIQDSTAGYYSAGQLYVQMIRRQCNKEAVPTTGDYSYKRG